MILETSFRIFKTKYSHSWFDGEGARLYGGRWNSPGRRVLYTSSVLSLALLEILVHIGRETIVSAYSSASVTFDESLVTDITEIADLRISWLGREVSNDLRDLGDEWVASERSAVLKVPSIIVPHESNYLINISHPDSRKLIFGQPESFEIDERLLKV